MWAGSAATTVGKDETDPDSACGLRPTPQSPLTATTTLRQDQREILRRRVQASEWQAGRQDGRIPAFGGHESSQASRASDAGFCHGRQEPRAPTLQTRQIPSNRASKRKRGSGEESPFWRRRTEAAASRKRGSSGRRVCGGENPTDHESPFLPTTATLALVSRRDTRRPFCGSRQLTRGMIKLVSTRSR